MFEHVDTLDFGALTLCRALHPFVLGALYRSLHLVTERDLRRFACALRRHPERGLLPRSALFGQAALGELDKNDVGAGQLDNVAAFPSRTVDPGVTSDSLTSDDSHRCTCAE